MPDICIFYSEPDQDKVEALSAILKNLGWSVWWDDDIKNGRWGAEIERNIKIAKCVISIWNSRALRNKSITFVEADKARQLNKPMITLVSEDIEPPLPFSAEHITANVSEWNCRDDADCVNDIVESVETVLGLAPKKWRGERPSMINLLGKQVKLPCFVKSLSSHETQLDPEQGLFTLSLFPEVDAILVSAYDMHLTDDQGTTEEEQEQYKIIQDQHEFMCEKLEEFHERGTFILMDSGNYEKSRKNDDTWTIEKFNWVLDNVPYNYAFCFDNLEPSTDPVANAVDVINRIEGDHEDFLIPILHAPVDDDGVRIHELLPDIFFEYATRKESPFIAVPERELGEGICKKAETIIKIREKLNTLDHYQPIHILGTGNPLSILILAAAGADLFDGLEWCRTVADKRTGFLFHHQQFDFFKSQTLKNTRFPFVKEILEGDDARLNLKMAMHNLQFFIEWMEELQASIKTDNIREMIKDRAVFGTHEFVDEFKYLMPGLFK